MIGMPIPSTQVEIRDEAGRELPVGQEGELCVKGPHVMRGYWNMPIETASVLSIDGWLRTGIFARWTSAAISATLIVTKT